MRSHFEHLEVNGNALMKYDLQADVGVCDLDSSFINTGDSYLVISVTRCS